MIMICPCYEKTTYRTNEKVFRYANWCPKYVKCQFLKNKTVREDPQNLEITDDLWNDRIVWRARIRLANLDNFGNELG